MLYTRLNFNKSKLSSLTTRVFSLLTLLISFNNNSIGNFLTSAERISLSNYDHPIPNAKTLQVIDYITVDADSNPQLSVNGPIRIENKAAYDQWQKTDSTAAGFEIVVVHHDTLMGLKDIPDEFQTICCKKEYADKKLCDADEFYFGSEKTMDNSFYKFKISKQSLENGVGLTNILYKIPKTGVYYVTLSNCSNSFPPSTVRFSAGELVISTDNGYLPAQEFPKLNFYFYLLIAYCMALSVWVMWCSKWSDILFKIHHYITFAIVSGVVEVGTWYIALYHWNYVGHRWWFLSLLASFATVLKQGICYGLLLLACLGLGVTKEKLESRQLVQCFILVSIFVCCDCLRQLVMVTLEHKHLHSELSPSWKIILLVLPGNFFVSLLFLWIFQALQETIKTLEENKQDAKLNIYSKLRTILFTCMSLALLLSIYEFLYVRGQDMVDNWQNKYLYYDVFSHLIFYAIVFCIMVLWRPSERSAQIAYSTQLQGNDNNCVGNGNNISDSHAQISNKIGIEMIMASDLDGNDKDSDYDNHNDLNEAFGGGNGSKSSKKQSQSGSSRKKNGGKNFNSVDVELGDDDDEGDNFSFKQSMEESRKSSDKPVLE